MGNITMLRELAQEAFDELTDWNSPTANKLRAILAAPVVEGPEPFAWLTQCKLSGLIEQAEPNEKASNPEHWTDAFPVYASPPAPVSVVLPERKTGNDYFQSMTHSWHDAELLANEYNSALDDVRACLDKVKELNP